MSKIILGLLIIILAALLFLLFWIVILSIALILFGRKGREENSKLIIKERIT